MAKRTSEFSATYVDSVNVKSLGLKHPILITKPSARKVEVCIHTLYYSHRLYINKYCMRSYVMTTVAN